MIRPRLIIITLLLAVLTTDVRAGEAIDARGELSSTELTTADRVTLTVTVDTDPAYTVEPWREAAAAALAGAGWTVVSSAASAPVLAESGRVRRSASFVLEPFLAGRYPFPEIVITALGPGGERRTASVTVPEVTVRSLLPEDEPVQIPGMPAPDSAGALGGDLVLGTLRPAPEPAQPGRGVLVLILIGASFAVAAVALLVARRVWRAFRRGGGADPVADLDRLVRSVRTIEDLAPVDHAVRLAARRYGVQNDLDGLLARLERVRYAPPDSTESAARDGTELDVRGLACEAAEAVHRAVGAVGGAGG